MAGAYSIPNSERNSDRRWLSMVGFLPRIVDGIPFCMFCEIRVWVDSVEASDEPIV